MRMEVKSFCGSRWVNENERVPLEKKRCFHQKVGKSLNIIDF